MAATSGAGTAYPFGESEFTPGFCWGSCYTIFSFMCKFLYIAVCSCVLFLLAIVLCVVLQFTAADYLFGIFKLFMIFVDFKHSIMISSLFDGCKLIRQKKGSVRP
jgi:hypothetical protein